MRSIRRLALLALFCCASLASATSFAAAATVRNEATGLACSAIAENFTASPEVTGGCPILGTATDFEIGGAFGIMVTCDITFEAKMNAAGATNGAWAINAASGGCESNSATPCTTARDRHMSTSAAAFPSAPYYITANMCVVAFGLTNRCTGVIGSLDEYGYHWLNLSFSHGSRCANGTNSLQGTILFSNDAAHPKLEIS